MPRLWLVDVLAETSSGRWSVEPSEASVAFSRSHTAIDESAPPDMRLEEISVVGLVECGRTDYRPSNRSMAMLLTPAACAKSLVWASRRDPSDC